MTTPEKITLRLFLLCIILCPIAIGIHYAIFPEETKCILVDSQGFEEKGRIYYTDSTSETSVDQLQKLIDSASARVANFWGEKWSDPDYIFLEKENDYAGYCKNDAPAVTYLKMGAHIVLSKAAADVDIIAHELSHAELYERIGFFKWSFSIPTWFKQGLAMQNDHRSYYSEDTLKMLTAELQNIDIKNYETEGSFYYGTEEEVMSHYALAKKEVKAWYTPEKLKLFVEDINAGKSFFEAYGLANDASITEEITPSDSTIEEVVAAPVAEEPVAPPTVEEEAPVKKTKKAPAEGEETEDVKVEEFKTYTPPPDE